VGCRAPFPTSAWPRRGCGFTYAGASRFTHSKACTAIRWTSPSPASSATFGSTSASHASACSTARTASQYSSGAHASTHGDCRSTGGHPYSRTAAHQQVESDRHLSYAGTSWSPPRLAVTVVVLSARDRLRDARGNGGIHVRLRGALCVVFGPWQAGRGSKAESTGWLSFVPQWSPSGSTTTVVVFQPGRLLHDIEVILETRVRSELARS
jgi:hypothetical protein